MFKVVIVDEDGYAYEYRGLREVRNPGYIPSDEEDDDENPRTITESYTTEFNLSKALNNGWHIVNQEAFHDTSRILFILESLHK